MTIPYCRDADTNICSQKDQRSGILEEIVRTGKHTRDLVVLWSVVGETWTSVARLLS